MLHGFSLREVLANEAIGVLVGSPLPRMMRSREVEKSPSGLLHGLIAVELAPVVGGHGLDPELRN